MGDPLGTLLFLFGARVPRREPGRRSRLRPAPPPPRPGRPDLAAAAAAVRGLPHPDRGRPRRAHRLQAGRAGLAGRPPVRRRHDAGLLRVSLPAEPVSVQRGFFTERHLARPRVRAAGVASPASPGARSPGPSSSWSPGHRQRAGRLAVPPDALRRGPAHPARPHRGARPAPRPAAAGPGRPRRLGDDV